MRFAGRAVAQVDDSELARFLAHPGEHVERERQVAVAARSRGMGIR